jgi:predicted nucleic acid-binding protein
MAQAGMKKMAALHLACASQANADYFLTTDDDILKKSALVAGIQIRAPIGFIKEVFP